MDITRKYNFINDDEPINDSWGFIDIINRNCHYIEECDITYSGTINMSHIASFVNNNDQLKLLELTNSSYYTNNDPKIIYNRNTTVKSVYCYDFEDPFSGYMDDNRDSNLDHLFSSVENFTEIILDSIYMLSDDFIRLIIRKNYTTLVSFKIEVLDPNWSLSSIRTMITDCKLLKKLSLSHCDHVLDAEFYELCSAPNVLYELVIENANHITTTTLIKLISQSSHLYSFNFRYCPLLNNKLIREFLQKKQMICSVTALNNKQFVCM